MCPDEAALLERDVHMVFVKSLLVSGGLPSTLNYSVGD